jgi:UDP-glucose 4-epimerase
MKDAIARPNRPPLESKAARPRVIAFTGAASFLGTNLIGLMQEDERISRIVAIDTEPPPTAGAKTRLYQVDLTQPTSEARLAEILQAERADTLVHLAFLPSPTTATAWAHELESVGTMHALMAAKQARIKKLVLWSQTLLYGAYASNPNFLTEDHPLRASEREPFFGDKIAAEREVLKFAQRNPSTQVTVLRTAPILGPTVSNFLTRYLARRFVPTLMGFDPLVQFLHEIDAITAFMVAIHRNVAGTFNVVSDGVLPLSTVIRLAGRTAIAVPQPLAEAVTRITWPLQLADAPPGFIRYLRYLFVADGYRSREVLGFVPAYTSRDAVLDFTSAQRLRDVQLLQEASR